MHDVETMAWTSERPWHGLGTEVAGNLSAEEMMKAAGLDWEVALHQNFTQINGEMVALSEMSLVRETDSKVFCSVGEDWHPVQNKTAFDFFHDFVEEGKMTMETAGALGGGRRVWALAKVGEDFTVFGGDKVESYLLFTNPHIYGQSIDVRFTPVRVVCHNTITAALNVKTGNIAKSSHRVAFDPETVKKTLGMAHKKMEVYKETAEFLGSKLYTQEDVEAFFNEVFPVISTKTEKKKERSINAGYAMAALTHQPGMEFAPGSWWQAVNAVTYVTDHMMGRSDENRVASMWYGSAGNKKAQAFDLAKDFANKS